jgi:RHS repeat-associated protein
MHSRLLPFLIMFASLLLAAFSASAITRPTGYGAVPGYQPLPLANGASIALASAWRGRWADITGFYNFGLRPYDPISGRWLTYDSVWNEIDASGMSYCGGDPINGVDSDGRLGKGFYQSGEGAVTGTLGLLWNIGGSLGYGVTSIFSQEAASEIYGSQWQGLENTGAGLEYLGGQLAQGNFGTVGTALTGGANQSGAYRVGYGAASIGLLFAGGEIGEAGEVGEGATTVEAGTEAAAATTPEFLPTPTVPEAPVNVLPSSGSTFVVSPGGDAIVVPEGASGPVPNINQGGTTTGFGYTGGSGGPGLDPRVSNVRIMDPTLPNGPSPGYPAGYVNYQNALGQSVNPFTGQTIAPNNPLWHIPLTPP